MEILILVFLYYLTQNPCFAESVKPLMESIKDSEQMLSFLKDLSNFSKSFHCEPKTGENAANPPNPEPQQTSEKKNPQSPTQGIADTFIQNILDNYLKNQPTQ